jgi:hypothetical protein
MAQEITIDINIVTNAAPAAAKISKELDGVKRKAKEAKVMARLRREHRMLKP